MANNNEIEKRLWEAADQGKIPEGWEVRKLGEENRNYP
jgi:hypothetical protein